MAHLITQQTPLELSEEEFSDHASVSAGICLNCSAWTMGVEPDGRDYPCESCAVRAVYGAEEALIMGLISFTEED